MINGTIRRREIVIELELFARGQSPQRCEAVIDTGYNGYLTLPGTLVNSLQLQFAGHRRAMLADGSIIRLDTFLAEIFWHGRQQSVLISQAEGSPLVGMALLEGSRVTMDVVDGGLVAIDEILSP